jgi:hypothetical protein
VARKRSDGAGGRVDLVSGSGSSHSTDSTRLRVLFSIGRSVACCSSSCVNAANRSGAGPYGVILSFSSLGGLVFVAALVFFAPGLLAAIGPPPGRV